MSGAYKAMTISGHPLGEVASAFQKSIRRGFEADALHWGVELDISNYGEYAWKRMRIMTSEDVGLAEMNLPATIYALYQNWIDQRKKKDDKHGPERLYLIHAILLLARSQKSRIVDHALITCYGNHTKWDIPDYALDKHTGAGRRKGRGVKHFFEDGITLANASPIRDMYQEMAYKTMLRTEGTARDQDTFFEE